MTIFRHNYGCVQKEKEGFVLIKSGEGNPFEFKCHACGRQVSVMDTLSLNVEDLKYFMVIIDRAATF